MKRILYVLVLLIVNVTILKGQVTYYGNKTLNSQSSINQFCFDGYTHITGNLLITGDDITHLDSLYKLTYVGGFLSVSHVDSITTLSGLQSVDTIGGQLYIGSNDSLENLTGLSSVDYVGDTFKIRFNPKLTSLNGLSSTTHYNSGFYLDGNPLLSSLDALNGVESFSQLEIDNCLLITDLNAFSKLDTLSWLRLESTGITTLDGLDSLKHINSLRLTFNNNLVSIDKIADLTIGYNIYIDHAGNNMTSLAPLSHLDTIYGELKLRNLLALDNLSGLDSLKYVGNGLKIINTSVTSIEALANLDYIGGDLHIRSNNQLETLDGLESLNTIGGNLVVGHSSFGNDTLGNFCGLYNVLNSGGFSGSYYVGSNLYNPTQLEITTGNCSITPCDSVPVTIEICEGDSILVSNNVEYAEGTYTDTLENIYGCDSIIYIDLTFNTATEQTFTDTICNGDFIQIGNQTYSTTGTYTDTLLNYCGLDSIIHLNLTVHPNDTVYITDTICDGTAYLLDSLTFTSSGIYTHHLINQYACDSVIILDLTVSETFETDVHYTLCNEDSVHIGTQYYSIPGDYIDTLETVYGCDSVLNISVDTINTLVALSGSDLISDQTNAEYQWLSCTDNSPIQGETNQTFTPVINGSYAVEITFNGCIDTSMCIPIEGISIPEAVHSNLEIYPNPVINTLSITLNNTPVNGRIQIIDLLGKVHQTIFPINQSHVNITLETLPEGIYELVFTSNKYIQSTKLIKL